eukprot:comp15145_c0_seq1/m.11840 comp15145_c0_seq1/g.11840  ORF comp15145_c0_seq1/g.11840 comp15145_c0_seq1/m.11840 type:complete len:306 (-) comp15145_c0_seq1:417-1334(-)
MGLRTVALLASALGSYVLAQDVVFDDNIDTAALDIGDVGDADLAVPEVPNPPPIQPRVLSAPAPAPVLLAGTPPAGVAQPPALLSQPAPTNGKPQEITVKIKLVKKNKNAAVAPPNNQNAFNGQAAAVLPEQADLANEQDVLGDLRSAVDNKLPSVPLGGTVADLTNALEGNSKGPAPVAPTVLKNEDDILKDLEQSAGGQLPSVPATGTVGQVLAALEQKPAPVAAPVPAPSPAPQAPAAAPVAANLNKAEADVQADLEAAAANEFDPLPEGETAAQVANDIGAGSPDASADDQNLLDALTDAE